LHLLDIIPVGRFVGTLGLGGRFRLGRECRVPFAGDQQGNPLSFLWAKAAPPGLPPISPLARRFRHHRLYSEDRTISGNRSQRPEGKAAAEQQWFIDMINEAGGLAFVALWWRRLNTLSF
jgi:hypothetical protein